MEAQALLILSGHFIGNLPHYYANHWVERGELKALLPDQVEIASPFCVVTRAGRRPSLIARSFIQELVARLWQQSHLVEAYKGDELLPKTGSTDDASFD